MRDTKIVPVRKPRFTFKKRHTSYNPSTQKRHLLERRIFKENEGRRNIELEKDYR